MKVSPIPTTILQQNPGGDNAAVDTQVGAGKKGDSRASGGRDIAVLSADRIQLNKINDSNTEIQRFSQQVRQVNQVMEKIQDHVDKMEKSLDGIVKIYPPLPPDSKERVEALREFRALRKMIDHLTFPSKSIDGVKILADPQRSPEAGSWQVAINHGQGRLRLSARPMHTGSEGLNLPELALDASDEQVHQAYDRTLQAKQVASQRRVGLTNEFNKLVSALG